MHKHYYALSGSFMGFALATICIAYVLHDGLTDLGFSFVSALIILSITIPIIDFLKKGGTV